MGTQQFPNTLVSSSSRKQAGSPYPNVLASSRKPEPTEVDLTDLAAQQQRPIEELQRTFRAAREPVEQAQRVSIPAGAEIKRTPKPTAAPTWRPLGPVGRAYALAPTPEEAPALRETGRAFGKALTEPISAQLGGGVFQFACGENAWRMGSFRARAHRSLEGRGR